MEIDEDEEKTWVPKIVCDTCRLNLNRWYNGGGHMPFGRPMVWNKPIDHGTQCYVCMTPALKYSRRSQEKIPYPKDSVAELPQPHGRNLPIPKPNGNDPASAGIKHVQLSEDDEFNFIERKRLETTEIGGDIDIDPTFISPSIEIHLLTQGDLMDLVRDLYLTKEMSEVLGSRLKEWNLLAHGESLP